MRAAARCGFGGGALRAAAELPSFGSFPGGLPRGFMPWTLREAWEVSPDSKVLRFALPEHVESLVALGAPSGVKVRREIGGHVLDKSYSPVSLPNAKGHVDLLVKRYPPRPGGGLGAFLCDMQQGDEVEIKLKPPRNLGLAPYAANRFEDVVLIGNGTGVAPLLQLGEVIRYDPAERTLVHFIAAHRCEEDRLLQDRIDGWVAALPHFFCSHTALSRPRDATAWRAAGGWVGRINLHFLRGLLPKPSPSVLVLVCGTDGFLETVCGGLVRITEPGATKATKLQGPIAGILGELGFGSAGATVVKL